MVQDHKKAAKWYQGAADQGVAHAQVNLGLLYANGYGVKTDRVFAYALWRLAADAGIALAGDNLRDLDGKLTPRELTEAEGIVNSWKPGMHLARRSQGRGTRH